MSRSRQAGFSILELFAILLIVSLATAIAALLMAEAQRRSVIEHRRALEATVPTALKQLRADVSAAVSASGNPREGEPLKLVLPSGLEIFYELTDDRIVRRLSKPAGQRTLLDGVTSFSWECLSGVKCLCKPELPKPFLEIEVEYLRTRGSKALVVGGERVPTTREVRQQTLYVVLRGGGGVGW